MRREINLYSESKCNFMLTYAEHDLYGQKCHQINSITYSNRGEAGIVWQRSMMVHPILLFMSIMFTIWLILK